MLCAGAFCCLGWLAAIYLDVTPILPHPQTLIVRTLLLLWPPVMIVLVGAVIGRTALSRLALALGVVLLAALPAALLRPPGALTEVWLARGPVLAPALSAGVAIGFAWPLARGRSPRSTAWGGGLRAAAVGALGFCLPLLALIAFEVYALLTFAKPCPGQNCYFGYIEFAYLGLVEAFAAVFSLLLVLLGGAFGALLRGEGSGET
ncbi:MAG: hypothetical protein IVW57_18455 [Ktedonobacterales bacterium]|nr:hypothetical protein [Ktedonobacterales bacterium]